MKVRALLAGAIALGFSSLPCSVVHASSASNYPTQAIRAIVPFPAGGINDTVGRLVLNKLATTLGAEVVIDNRPGAGGMIGTKIAVDSATDGYTILLGAASTISVAPNLYKEAKYRPEKDLVAVGGIASVASVLVAGANSSFKNLEDVLAAAKRNPGELNYGSAGAGTSHHVQTELLALQAGVKLTHVPYKGGAPAMTDLIGSQIQLLLEPLPTALPHIKAQRVKALGITVRERSPLLPTVPTFIEAGVKDYSASTWFGVFAPAGTPGTIVEKLSQALFTTLKDPALQADLRARGIEPMAMQRKAFEKFVASEDKVWNQVIQEAKLQVQ
ncbi:MAG TPA: tripartite tricarboxylate transporter substrate binding protein [Eoetvoesiella sp.]